MAHWPIGGPEGSLRFLSRPQGGRAIYIHVNNTNPILREDSPERRAVDSRGARGRVRRHGAGSVSARRRCCSRRRVRRAAARRGDAPLSRSAPVPSADARGQADARRSRDLDAEPLLLPDAHPDQGRDHRLQVGGSGVPARLDPPHPRSRRRRRTSRSRAGWRCGCGWPRRSAWIAKRSRAAGACCRASASPATATSACAGRVRWWSRSRRR